MLSLTEETLAWTTVTSDWSWVRVEFNPTSRTLVRFTTRIQMQHTHRLKCQNIFFTFERSLLNHSWNYSRRGIHTHTHKQTSHVHTKTHTHNLPYQKRNTHNHTNKNTHRMELYLWLYHWQTSGQGSGGPLDFSGSLCPAEDLCLEERQEREGRDVCNCWPVFPKLWMAASHLWVKTTIGITVVSVCSYFAELVMHYVTRSSGTHYWGFWWLHPLSHCSLSAHYQFAEER